MVTATRHARSLRATREKDGPTAVYAAAIGMISGVVRHATVYDDPIVEIRQILAAVDEVTGYDQD